MSENASGLGMRFISESFCASDDRLGGDRPDCGLWSLIQCRRQTRTGVVGNSAAVWVPLR